MRAVLLLTTALAGAVALRAATRPAMAPIAPSEPQPPEMADITRNFLLAFVLPLWLAAGIADYLCHRASHIERNAGPKESLMHLLMLSEAAVPVLAGLFLEITSPVLALMIASLLLHDATALWDVSYAVRRREVTPLEQHAHSFLEMVPLMAVAFVAVLHWPQLRALLGFGPARPDWSIRWKRRKLPARYVWPMLGAQVTLEWLPYLEELVRTLRARPAPALPRRG